MQFSINLIDDPKNKIKTINAILGNDKVSAIFNEEVYQTLLSLESKFEDATTVEEAKTIIDQAVKILNQGVEISDIEEVDEYVVYNKISKKYFLRANGKVFESYPMPKIFADKVVEIKEKGLSPKPLIRNMIRLMRNPRFSEDFVRRYLNYITTPYVDSKRFDQLIEQGYDDATARQMSTFEDVSFTSSGLLSTYKYAAIKFKKFDKETGEEVDNYEFEFDEVTGQKRYKLENLSAEDYSLIPPVMGTNCDPFFVDGELSHFIKMGATHKLDKTDGGTYQHNHMSKGLYVGGLRYIDGYAGENRILLNVFIDPAKICAFNENGQFAAIKTSEYFVHSAVDVPSKSLYKESSYLQQTEEEWNNILSETVADLEARKVKIEKEIDQANNLTTTI